MYIRIDHLWYTYLLSHLINLLATKLIFVKVRHITLRVLIVSLNKSHCTFCQQLWVFVYWLQQLLVLVVCVLSILCHDTTIQPIYCSIHIGRRSTSLKVLFLYENIVLLFFLQFLIGSFILCLNQFLFFYS